ncbi:hypothetical protein ALC53_12455 [Atta colombica]|uniref:Uncharacterized protein n=1 Tax=Atta colombica TaxID=520822 RepID=A0A195AYP4_9HYME|nr:hypothetical protein ALC53_12455 [Atta colombica]
MNKLVQQNSRRVTAMRGKEKENETLGSMTRNEFFGQVDEEEGKDGRSAEGKKGREKEKERKKGNDRGEAGCDATTHNDDLLVDCHCTRCSRKTRPKRKKRVDRT